jgi:YidC/Oxa1 family membrane protein insertase
MPVFISLFYMLRKDLKEDICGPALKAAGKVSNSAIQNTGCDEVAKHSAKFWFIPDLTHSATGGVLITLIVLYVGSQLLSSIFMSATADKNQRMIMLALPFVFVLFIQNFPAGLLVYWITTNFWTVGQGFYVRRTMPPPPPPPSKGGDGKNGGGETKGLLGRLTGTTAAPEPAAAAAPARTTAPPPPPRKKKKRSGRRR